MRKNEISKAKDNELIVDYVRSFAMLIRNDALRCGTKQLEKHCKDLEAELIKRGILTAEDINYLNS